MSMKLLLMILIDSFLAQLSEGLHPATDGSRRRDQEANTRQK